MSRDCTGVPKEVSGDVQSCQFSRNQYTNRQAMIKQMKQKQGGKPKTNGQKKSKSKQQGQASVAAAYATQQLGKAPKITQNGDSVRIRHRELVSGITGSVGFTIANTIALNPGLAASFPWLSTIANSWEEYSFNALKFEYFTRTGSSTPGSVIMSPDYDASDAAPASEQQICSYQDVIEDAPWKDICCNLPSNRMNSADKFRFVRSGALAANQDIKLYDVGNLFVATLDGTAVNWGKLWVEYDVTFRIPQLGAGSTGPSAGGSFVGGGVFSTAVPFGTVPVPDPQNSGISLSNASVLTFSALGDYVVNYILTGAGMVAVDPVAGAGLTILAMGDNGGPTPEIYGLATVRVTSLVDATLAITCATSAPTSSSLSVGKAPDSSL